MSIEFNTPASFIAFIESSLTRKFDIKIKAHVLRSEIIFEKNVKSKLYDIENSKTKGQTV